MPSRPAAESGFNGAHSRELAGWWKKPLAGCSKGQIREFASNDMNGLNQSTLKESEAIERQRNIWVFFISLLA